MGTILETTGIDLLLFSYNLDVPTKGNLRTLYIGIVEPHFKHWCSIWGCADSTEIK